MYYSTYIKYSDVFGVSYVSTTEKPYHPACTPSNTILQLSNFTNAHAENASGTTYLTPICYGDLTAANCQIITSGDCITDYQYKSKETHYKFNNLKVFCLDDTTFMITKIIAGRARDIEEISPFLKKEWAYESVLRKRFSELKLDENKAEAITQKFESFISGYFHKERE